MRSAFVPFPGRRIVCNKTNNGMSWSLKMNTDIWCFNDSVSACMKDTWRFGNQCTTSFFYGRDEKLNKDKCLQTRPALHDSCLFWHNTPIALYRMPLSLFCHFYKPLAYHKPFKFGNYCTACRPSCLPIGRWLVGWTVNHFFLSVPKIKQKATTFFY